MVCWPFKEPLFDDPYILFRYAQNLLRGHGWTYNLGERLNASTSTLYPLLLAFLSLGTRDVVLSSRLINFSCLFMASLFTYLTMSRCTSHVLAGLLCAILLLTNPLILITFGMESSLLLALLAVSLFFYLRERFLISAFFQGLLFLARPDGILFSLVLLAHYLWRRREVPWRAVALYLAMILPWLLYSFFHFGSFFPLSLGAKMAQGHSGFLPKLFLEGMVYWLRIMLRNSFWLSVTFFYAAYGLFCSLERRLPYVLVFLWLVIYTVSYSILRVPYYHWYYVPHAYTLILFASLGLEAFCYSDGRGRADRAAFYLLLLGLLALLLGKGATSCFSLPLNTFYAYKFWLILAFILAHLFFIMDMKAGRVKIARARLFHLLCPLLILPQILSYPDAEAFPKVHHYAQVGHWLKENTPDSATVAMAEIGVIGYYSERNILDFMGLTRPEASEFLNNKDLKAWFFHFKPDYIVFHQPPWGYEEEVYNLPQFQRDYRLIKAFDFSSSPDPTVKGMAVYEKKRKGGEPLSLEKERSSLPLPPFQKET